jgi:hypothetical protein
VGGACNANGGEEDRIKVIGRKSRKKETTRKTKTRWMDNIKMDLVEMGFGGVDWSCQAEERALVDAAMNLLVP